MPGEVRRFRGNTIMMPWEHAIVGYIAFSLLVRAAYREPPTGIEALTVAFAALLPDLIDKPLTWEFNLWGSGHALGHSVFVAGPLSVAVVWLAAARGRTRVGIAFALGYFSHLVTDVVPQSMLEGESHLDRILWPIRGGGDGYDTGFREELAINIDEYARWVGGQIASDDPHPYVFVVFGTIGLGLVLWIYDGMPVVRELTAVARNAVGSFIRSG